jgi:hypothetical protein
LGQGEEILFQIAARSPSKRSWFFGLREEVIGKFVVTNRRVMFLSSGKSDGFGITYTSMVRRIARSVDYSAMCKRSSWEFELPRLRSVEAPENSIWTGLHLQLTGADRCGMEVKQKVCPFGVKQQTWEELVARLRQMKQGGGQVG